MASHTTDLGRVTASERTLNITELRELVLSNLPADDLARCRRVASSWNDSITRPESETFQPKLFLAPAEATDVIEWSRWDFEGEEVKEHRLAVYDPERHEVDLSNWRPYLFRTESEGSAVLASIHPALLSVLSETPWVQDEFDRIQVHVNLDRLLHMVNRCAVPDGEKDKHTEGIMAGLLRMATRFTVPDDEERKHAGIKDAFLTQPPCYKITLGGSWSSRVTADHTYDSQKPWTIGMLLDLLVKLRAEEEEQNNWKSHWSGPLFGFRGTGDVLVTIPGLFFDRSRVVKRMRPEAARDSDRDAHRYKTKQSMERARARAEPVADETLLAVSTLFDSLSM